MNYLKIQITMYIFFLWNEKLYYIFHSIRNLLKYFTSGEGYDRNEDKKVRIKLTSHFVVIFVLHYLLRVNSLKLRCFNAFLRPLINIDSMDEIIHHEPNRYHISLHIHWTLWLFTISSISHSMVWRNRINIY